MQYNNPNAKEQTNRIGRESDPQRKEGGREGLGVRLLFDCVPRFHIAIFYLDTNENENKNVISLWMDCQDISTLV